MDKLEIPSAQFEPLTRINKPVGKADHNIEQLKPIFKSEKEFAQLNQVESEGRSVNNRKVMLSNNRSYGDQKEIPLPDQLAVIQKCIKKSNSTLFDLELYNKFIKALNVYEQGDSYNTALIHEYGVSKYQEYKQFAVDKCQFLFLAISEKLNKLQVEMCYDYICELLDILGHFYYEKSFISCITVISQYLLKQRMTMGNYQAHVGFDQFFNLFCELIANKPNLKYQTDDFFDLLISWMTDYIDFYISQCCEDVLSDYSEPVIISFQPEKIFNLMLRLYKCDNVSNKFYGKIKAEYMKMMNSKGLPDRLKINSLNFDLLTGKAIDPKIIVSKIKNGWSFFNSESLTTKKSNNHENRLLLRCLHHSSVRLLSDNPEAMLTLLKCYDLFFSDPAFGKSAVVMKNYMTACYYQERGDNVKAKEIYRKLIDHEIKVPVFDRFIQCCDKERDTAEIEQIYQEAFLYYEEKNILLKSRHYEYKASSVSFLLRKSGILSDGGGGSETSRVEKTDLDSIAGGLEVKSKSSKAKHKKHKKNTKKGRRCKSSGHARKLHTDIQNLSEITTLSDSKNNTPVKNQDFTSKNTSIMKQDYEAKDSWFYPRQLNKLFDDYFCLPSVSIKEAIINCAQEAERRFPNDIWILHSAGWGFYLVEDYDQALTMLRRGLCLSLQDEFPEIREEIPEDIKRVSQWLGKIEKAKITTDGVSGLDVAAFLSSLGHVFCQINMNADARKIWLLADHLNTARHHRCTEKKALSTLPKQQLISPEQAEIIRHHISQ